MCVYGVYNPHSKNFLRLSSCSHVGVVDLFQHHPRLIVFPRLSTENNQTQSDPYNIAMLKKL